MGIAHAENHFVGVDVGQVQDHSAIAVIARRPEFPEGRPNETYSMYYAAHLKRFELGTPYYQVEEEIARIWALPELKLTRNFIVVDGTGTGSVFVENLRRNKRLHIQAVTITGGQTVSETRPDEFHVAKEALVSALINQVQRRRFKVVEGVENESEFFEELSTFGYTVQKTGNTTYESLKESIHDDLVVAASLAVWFGEKRIPSSIGRPKAHIDPNFHNPFARGR